MVSMRASRNCIALIKRSEGFSAKPYLCPAGIPTIGYGSTYYDDGRKVKLTDSQITEAQAEALLCKIVAGFEVQVSAFLLHPIPQGQFDALVDFAYNFGANALRTSTLLKKVNAGDNVGAANELDKWVHCDGKVSAGLVARRAAEKKLFLQGTI